MGKDDFTKIPNGGPGIEHRMSLIYSGGVAKGRFSVNRFVELVSTTPAKIFGLYPRKGTITVGSDADLVVYDPTTSGVRSAKTHHSRCDRSIFDGFKVKGSPSYVVVNGRVQFEDGKLAVERGAGRFIAREVAKTDHPLPITPAATGRLA